MSYAVMFVIVCILLIVLAVEVQVSKITKKLDELLERKH